jgi:hypothetical protein
VVVREAGQALNAKPLVLRDNLAMRYLVLVSDYDGTIATEGQAETAALKAPSNGFERPVTASYC